MTLSAADHSYLRSFAHDAAAIVLETRAAGWIERQLRDLAVRVGLSGPAEIVAELRKQRRGPLAQAALDALVTNETSFFRDPAVWRHLRERALPALIEARSNARALDVWCAAASSGQEPYSLVMLLRDEFPEFADWSVRVLASDLSHAMVRRGREGLYSQLEVERGLSPHGLERHFAREGREWRIRSDLRCAVEWREFNLTGRAWGSLGRFDLVLLRNVLIYFGPAARRGVLGEVRNVLRPDGCLVLGTAESTACLEPRFALQAPQSACFGAPPERPT